MAAQIVIGRSVKARFYAAEIKMALKVALVQRGSRFIRTGAITFYDTMSDFSPSTGGALLLEKLLTFLKESKPRGDDDYEPLYF